MKPLIIFDLDGTLIDSLEDLANSVNHALKSNNYPIHPVESYQMFIGNGLNKLIERALPKEDRHEQMIAKLRLDFMEHYRVHGDNYTRPYPGISELLEKLSNENYQLAVASNKVHEATVALVKRFFPTITFTAVFGQRNDVPVKPDPQVINEIIALGETTKQNCLYIGDSGVDASTAMNAGISFVGVLWGLRPQSELMEAGATIFVKKSEELYEYIQNKWN